MELHEKLLEAAKPSVNAEIIQRLERSFEEDKARRTIMALAEILSDIPELDADDRRRIADLVFDISAKMSRHAK